MSSSRTGILADARLAKIGDLLCWRGGRYSGQNIGKILEVRIRHTVVRDAYNDREISSSIGISFKIEHHGGQVCYYSPQRYSNFYIIRGGEVITS